VIASDGSTDRTDEIVASYDGRVRLLRCDRAGKLPSMNRAVRETEGEILAFGDANARWAPDALRKLVRNFADPEVAYVCGQVRFQRQDGTNREGVYWRYEMWLRESESELGSITGGNGAIYAVRRRDYLEPERPMGHDLFVPFSLVKRRRRAVYVPAARAGEKMVPTVEGEWARKRRMMTQAWPIVLHGGLADPRGYPPRYAWMIASHRLLRYASPLLHVLAFVASVALWRRRPYRAAALAQAALVVAAALGGRVRRRPLLIARYYVLTTAALAAGLYDHLRHGTPQGWEPAEGTR
jgi:glycosyltransferase involved in cell wall biosynthesis